MKLTYMLSAALAISIISCAQDIPASKVPSIVLNAAQAKVQGATDIDWEKKKGYYEADYKVGKAEHSLHIDSTGTLLQHKWETDIAALPQAIQSTIKSKHPGYTVDDASVIDRKGQLIYELELEAKGKKDTKILLSGNGEIISNK